MSSMFQLFVCLAIIITASRSEPLFGDVSPPLPNVKFIVSIARFFDLTPDNPLGHTCGGALITKRYVLTAASCFKDGKTTDDYFVHVGNSDLAHSKTIGISRIVKFDEWYARRLQKSNQVSARSYDVNDIAMVKLAGKTKLPVVGGKVWDISSEHLRVVLNNQKLNLQTAGWTRPLMGNQQLQYMLWADLRLEKRDKCLHRLQIALRNATYTHEDNLFCTEGVGPRYTILDIDDKGSPVIARYDKDYRVVGINVKAIPAIGDVVEFSDRRNMHISVHSYIGFIRSVLADVL